MDAVLRGPTHRGGRPGGREGRRSRPGFRRERTPASPGFSAGARRLSHPAVRALIGKASAPRSRRGAWRGSWRRSGAPTAERVAAAGVAEIAAAGLPRSLAFAVHAGQSRCWRLPSAGGGCGRRGGGTADAVGCRDAAAHGGDGRDASHRLAGLVPLWRPVSPSRRGRSLPGTALDAPSRGGRGGPTARCTSGQPRTCNARTAPRRSAEVSRCRA